MTRPARPLIAMSFLVTFTGLLLGQEPPAPSSRGLALMGEGRFADAAIALEKELAGDPGNLRLGIARVKALLEAGRWKEAGETSEALLASHPGDPEATLLRGDVLFLSFDAGAAMDLYRPLLSDAKWRAAALSKFVNAALALRRDDEGLGALVATGKAGSALTPGQALLLASLEPDPEQRLRLLADLAVRLPSDEEVAGELKILRAQIAAGGSGAEGPAVYGTPAVIREVYRDPCVAVHLNGRKKRWLALDTGSAVVLLNEDLVKKLRLPAVAEKSLEGWGQYGTRRTPAVLLGSLEVAGRTLRNVPALVNSRDSEFWTNKAGYFGLGPFLDTAVLYDRRHGVFALYRTAKEAERALGGKGFSLPVYWIRGVPVVPVLLKAGDGSSEDHYPFMVDTGAPFSLLSLGPSRNMGIRIDNTRYPKIYGLGVSGAFSASLAERVTIGLGPKRYLRPAMPATDISRSFPVPLYGVLGRDILNDYAMVFDGPGNRIIFVPYD